MVFAQNIVDIAATPEKCLEAARRLRCVAAVVQALLQRLHTPRRPAVESFIEVSI
jgi:hypothetical protein